MNSQTQLDLDHYYGPAAYRRDDLPELPPTNRTGALVGRLRTPLRWGHYAQLDAWQDTDAYLKPGAELYRDSFERTGKTDLLAASVGGVAGPMTSAMSTTVRL